MFYGMFWLETISHQLTLIQQVHRRRGTEPADEDACRHSPPLIGQISKWDVRAEPKQFLDELRVWPVLEGRK